MPVCMGNQKNLKFTCLQTGYATIPAANNEVLLLYLTFIHLELPTPSPSTYLYFTIARYEDIFMVDSKVETGKYNSELIGLYLVSNSVILLLRHFLCPTPPTSVTIPQLSVEREPAIQAPFPRVSSSSADDHMARLARWRLILWEC